MSIIEVRNLTKSFDYFKKEPGLLGSVKSLFWRETLYKDAIRNINFNIEEGELVGFLGPNGAGKTTTLKILAGILLPSGGSARVLGYEPWKRDRTYQKQFSIVMGQKNQLWWDLPAIESFSLNREIYEIPAEAYKKKLAELVEIMDLKDLLQIQVRKLSLGERMKCELVAALLHEPRVLFLDEPTIGLDVVSQEKIRQFIETYNQVSRTTILLTSHYMRDVERLCKRVLVIAGGGIIYDGSLEDLVNRYVDHKIVTVQFRRPVPEGPIARFGEVVERDGLHMVIKIPKKEVPQRVQEILAGFPVEDLSVEEVKIEEVIQKIFESGRKS
ncbi:MAG TPA: ATP-binding cassette domain-containing protein [Nitrospiria bacterium]|nr:ATP-binding cassette domain-containing protein [Nitrospiria bacterium]